MIRWPLISWLALFVGGASPLASGNTDWPHWRGPNRDSIAHPSGRLLSWPADGLPKLWQTNVGTGFSSLAISQGRLFTLGNRNAQDTVYCLDVATGRRLWSHAYACALDPNLYQGGPSATPTVDGSVVYTLSKFGHLFCFSVTNGTIVWQTNLISGLGVQKPEWGFASSPLVEGNKLILNAGGHGLAVDKTTGQRIWISNTQRAGYSSVVPFDLDGVRAGVMLSYTSVVCVALADGQLLARVFWRSSFDMNCPDPIVHNGRIFATSVSKSGRMIQPDTGQFVSGFATVDLKTHLSPGVVISNHLYAFHGDAERSTQLRCVNLEDGAVRWTTDLPAGSLIAADNKLIVLTGDGELILAHATPTALEIISRAQTLTGRCWTMPALGGDRLFVRNAAGDVASFVLPVESPPQLDIRASAGGVEITWLTNAAGFKLESATALGGSASWTEVSDTPVSEGDRYQTTVASDGTKQFFRLKKP